MTESFEDMQARASQQLIGEGHDVVGSVDEAVSRLRGDAGVRVTLVLELFGNSVDLVREKIQRAGIEDAQVRSWSRGNLKGVLVYEISSR